LACLSYRMGLTLGVYCGVAQPGTNTGEGPQGLESGERTAAVMGAGNSVSSETSSRESGGMQVQILPRSNYHLKEGLLMGWLKPMSKKKILKGIDEQESNARMEHTDSVLAYGETKQSRVAYIRRMASFKRIRRELETLLI